MAIPDKAPQSPFPAPAWAPPPHPKFCYYREPRSRPRALPRPQTPLRPARARATTSVASGRPRAPRFSSLTPAGPGLGRWSPSRTHKLGWGTAGGERGNARHTLTPPPAARSPFMPGPRCSAAPDTCRSHRRPGSSELLISPGAARRRLGRSGRWSFRGLGQETPAAVAAEDTPKRNAAHSPAPARSRRPDLSRREVSGFSRKRTRAHRRTARSSQRGHSPPGRCRPRAPDPGWTVGGISEASEATHLQE